MLMFSMSSSSSRSCSRPRPELGGHQPAHDLLLLLGRGGGHGPVDHGAGRLVDGLAGQLLHERTPLAFAHAGHAVADDPVGHVFGRVQL